MPKDPLEEKLARLRALRDADATERIPALRRLLRERSNYLVAKAAELAGERGDLELVPDLLAVYDRLFGDTAAGTDPLVRAKNAIARALRALGHRDPAPFVRGLHHVQMEPAWGVPNGLQDTADILRCACAQALIDTDLPTAAALRELLPHLVDPIVTVRLDTVRAIAQAGGYEALLLLRLKAHTGDAEPEVVGECFLAVVDREPDDAVSFISPFLTHARDDVKVEAASALAMSRVPAALDVLRSFWAEDLSADVRLATVTSWAGSPQPAIVELLLNVVAEGDVRLAERAVATIAQSRFRDEARDRTKRAVQVHGDERLDAAFVAAFG